MENPCARACLRSGISVTTEATDPIYSTWFPLIRMPGQDALGMGGQRLMVSVAKVTGIRSPFSVRWIEC